MYTQKTNNICLGYVACNIEIYAHKRNVFYICAPLSKVTTMMYFNPYPFSPIVYFSLIKNCQRCFLNESVFYCFFLTPLYSSAEAEENQLDSVKTLDSNIRAPFLGEITEATEEQCLGYFPFFPSSTTTSAL